MPDAIVRFSRQGIEGAAPVGTNLADVMRRFGVRLLPPCDIGAGVHFCAVRIESGAEYLSPASELELEHLTELKRNLEFRIACDTKIAEAGEITVMTEEKKEGSKETAGEAKKTSKLVDEFEALPLEKKIADLVRMEAVALGETISFVINSPYLVLEKVVDVLAEFGMKLDREPKVDSSTPEPDKEPKGAKTAERPPSQRKKKPASRPARRPPAP